MKHWLRQISFLIFAALLMLPILAGAKSFKLKAQVVDSDGQPLIGATVAILSNGEILAGAATNTNGIIVKRLSGPIDWPLTLRASSVGYANAQITLAEISDEPILFELDRIDHQVSSISVNPEKANSASSNTYNSQQITEQAQTALVSTNVAAAIKAPQVNRAGSAHSSQLRVYGTSPMYYFNSVPIGYDPNHYGMFTLLPSSAITKTEISTLGTDASFGLPSVINLTGQRKFNKYSLGQIQLSTLDATASYSVGFGSGFLSGTVRKSVLDKLIKEFSFRTDKKTLPPTNFQDIVLAGGLQLSQRIWLRLDGYHTRDFLAYNVDQAADISSMSTRQHSQQRHLALHVDYIFNAGALNVSLAARDQYNEFMAFPDASGNMFVDLSESSRTGFGRVSLTLPKNSWNITIGTEGQYTPSRTVNLAQENWNFLPPFANSDNPYIYQEALNQDYSSFDYIGRQIQAAGYISVERQLGSLTIKAGPRIEYFSNLAIRKVAAFRFRATLAGESSSETELFFGTFNENPINNVLEPYQIQILDNIGHLKPINKLLLALSHTHDWLQVTAFAKQISNLPILSPDFDNAAEIDGPISPDFIRVTSTGSMNFYGGTLSITRDDFPLRKMSLSTAYAYTKAVRKENSLTIPYELEAPHQLHVDLNSQLSSRWKLGVRYQIRSGYPYTPSTSQDVLTKDRYSQEYYLETLSLTNSAQFSSHASLDLHGSYSAGSFRFFFALSNLTNHPNPIISSASGLIYDAGILPTLGISYKL